MKYEDYSQMLGQRFQEDILFACRFLESRGMKLHQNFGYENAIDLAAEVINTEMGDWK